MYLKSKDHIFKFLRFLVLLNECPVEIQTSIFQMTASLFAVNYLVDNCFENFDVGN